MKSVLHVVEYGFSCWVVSLLVQRVLGSEMQLLFLLLAVLGGGVMSLWRAAIPD